MLPRAVAVAVLSSIAIAASGCGGGSDPEAEFRAAFKKKFGEATWYQHVTGIEVEDTWVEITTDFDQESNPSYTGPDGRGICGIAMHFALNNEVGDGIEGVRMMGSDGVEDGGCG